MRCVCVIAFDKFDVCGTFLCSLQVSLPQTVDILSVPVILVVFIGAVMHHACSGHVLLSLLRHCLFSSTRMVVHVTPSMPWGREEMSNGVQ